MVCTEILLFCNSCWSWGDRCTTQLLANFLPRLAWRSSQS
jgi:hypothetical protein